MQGKPCRIIVLFLAQEKNEKNIHPPQGLDQWSTSVATRQCLSKLPLFSLLNRLELCSLATKGT